MPIIYKPTSTFKKVLIIAMATQCTWWLGGCVHEPTIGEFESGGGGAHADTVQFEINTKPCEPEIIYFENDVLPIFISNCAISGCHDVASAEDGVVLTNYQNIMKGIKANDLGDSEYYEVLVTNDQEDLMPRIPGTEQGYRLSSEQISTVREWIEQGAENNYCDACDTTEYSFSATIMPIITSNCATSVGCHGNGSKYGVFTNYDGIRQSALNGLVEQKVIVYKNMPPASPLADCEMLLIKNWLDAGALNN
jgi:hypothetical protein